MNEEEIRARISSTLDASETIQNILANALRRFSATSGIRQRGTARLIAFVTSHLAELSPEARTSLLEIINDLLAIDQQQAEVFGDVAESMEDVYRRLLT